MRSFGLIGFPLSHSFSGTYFGEKFRNEGISDCTYNLFPLEHIDLLPQLISENVNLLGLNVTIPYKEKVIPYLDETDDGISDVGAVNTIKIYRDRKKIRLKGFNTDMYGFSESIRPFVKPGAGNALILGTGGASKAVNAVLKSWNIHVTWVSRNPSKENQISYEQITPELMTASNIIINTSPLGMYPRVDSFPDIPYKYLSPAHILFDLVYNPEETLFMIKGKEKGAVVINGLKMLYLQAEKSWEIWNSDSL